MKNLPVFNLGGQDFYVKDAQAREDIGNVIKVQDEEPTEPANKIWLKETTPEGVQVPTLDEFDDLKSASVNSEGNIEKFIGDDWKVGLTTTVSGENIVSATATYSNGKLAVYGTPTSTRLFCCLNGQNVAKSSAQSFARTLPAGRYIVHAKATGTQGNRTNKWLAYTETTAANKVYVLDGGVIDTDVPVMVGINIVSNVNYGTSDAPTYYEVEIVPVPEMLDMSIFDQLKVTGSVSLAWSQGTIDGSTGGPMTSSTRCRSDYILADSAVYTLTLPSGCKGFIYEYSSESIDGYIAAYKPGWSTGTVNIKVAIGHYLRIVCAYTNDASITPSDCSGVMLGFAAYTDISLTKLGKAADASRTIGYKRVLTSSDDLDDIMEIGAYRWVSSSVPVNSPTISGGEMIVFGYGTYVAQIVVSAQGSICARAHVSNGWNDWNSFVKNEFDAKLGYVRVLTSEDDIDNVLDPGVYRWVSTSVPVNSPTKAPATMTIVGARPYVSQLVITQTGSICDRYHASNTWGNWSALNSANIPDGGFVDNPSSWGITNAFANANIMRSIKWTPVGNYPKTLSNSAHTDPLTYFDLTEQTGIPYSSTRYQDKAVGMDVSYRTFMTAVRDPNSVVYTRRSVCSNSASYYGSVCSGLVNVAFGLDLDLTNYFLGETDLFETVPMQSIQKCDMLYVSGHVALVSDVVKDDFGRIKSVTVMEEWRPLPRTKKYNSWEAFLNDRDGYIARRYKSLDSIPYTPSPFVQNLDETATEITYPDIQTEYGDAAVFMVGDDVKVNVINSRDFTGITVKHGETTVYSSSTIAAFTLQDVQAGLYTITADGGEYESESTFFVVDATASFNQQTGILTFSSTNATPVLVNVYDLPLNMRITCKPIILSDEDKTAGQIDVSEYMDNDYKYAKVAFKTPYGTAVWYSENGAKWAPIST